jgi:hypothetical protein
MKKLILSLSAFLMAHIGTSTAALAAASNTVGIFGTNSSQTNLIIPAGDSVYISQLLPRTNGYGYVTATINQTTGTTGTFNPSVKSCNFIIYDPQAQIPVNYTFLDYGPGRVIPGPAMIASTCPFQYKYFAKKVPYQVLLVRAGSTNSPVITIPAGQKLHAMTPFYGSGNNGLYALSGLKLNNLPFLSWNGTDDMSIPYGDVYGPSTLSLIINNLGTGSPCDLYFSYVLISSDATDPTPSTP